MTHEEQAPPPETAGSQSRWTAGRVIAVVFTGLGGLIGLALLLGGLAVFAAYAFARDGGYFNTNRKPLESSTYAITTEEIDLGADELDWAPEGILGTVRVQVESDQPVFVGIGADGWDGLPAASRAALSGADVLIGGGRQLALLPPECEGERVRWELYRGKRRGSRLIRMAPWFDDGSLTVTVQARYFWHNAAEAHREVEKGHTQGKIALIVDVDLSASLEV